MGVGVLQQRLGDVFVSNSVFHFRRLRAVSRNDSLTFRRIQLGRVSHLHQLPHGPLHLLLWPRREEIRRRDHVYRLRRRQQNRYRDHKYRHLVAPRLAHGSHVPHGVRFRWGCLPTRSLEDEEKSKTVAQEKTIFAAPSGRERRRPTKDVVKSINNRIEESHLVYTTRLCAINYKERMF